MKYPATLQIQTSPHIRRGLSTRSIMGNVVLALLPAACALSNPAFDGDEEQEDAVLEASAIDAPD